MTSQEVLDFINRNQVCTLATCDGGKPHVRWMMTYRAESSGVIFHTGDFKELFQQLQKNPNVELCFYNEDIQIRVQGIAVRDEDSKLKDEIIASRPFLNPIIAKHGRDSIKVFRVKEMVATLWTMQTNLLPKEYINVSEHASL